MAEPLVVREGRCCRYRLRKSLHSTFVQSIKADNDRGARSTTVMGSTYRAYFTVARSAGEVVGATGCQGSEIHDIWIEYIRKAQAGAGRFPGCPFCTGR